MCVGLVDETVSEFPSPQVISYLLAFPVAVIDNVIVSPDDIVTELDVNVTLFTYVLFLMFSMVSLRSSMASVTFVDVVNPVYAPSPNVESSGVPSVICVPWLTLDRPPMESSTYFLVDASESAAGSPTCTLARVRFE